MLSVLDGARPLFLPKLRDEPDVGRRVLIELLLVQCQRPAVLRLVVRELFVGGYEFRMVIEVPAEDLVCRTSGTPG